MNFTQQSIKILEKLEEAKTIALNDWPNELLVESEIKNAINTLDRYTNSESFLFRKEKGAVGNEYGISLFLFLDKIYLSQPVRGTYTNVSIINSFKADPVYRKENTRVLFNIQVGEKKYKSQEYETQKIKEKIIYGNAGTFHTHPKFYHDKLTTQYAFFSPQDISALIFGSGIFVGLIAGRHLWVACKTGNSRQIDPSVLAHASRLELQEGIPAVEEYIKAATKEYEVVIYSGKVGAKLKRL